ncbi:inactive CLIP domain-containing serine protease A30-like [Wyeomyia smithii]|uniref:inactive CLIP domain-containing serine protease A30-like n=1 Tax=Wyeomyia smithii TaxID=174621 RepID=UPI002467E5D8|nr:inactive CLIP domain-containing serine protease A30-like [Wyeomyia smithii]
MRWEVLVIFICSVELVNSQNNDGSISRRRTTTEDPVLMFFRETTTTTTSAPVVTTTTEEPLDDDYSPPSCGVKQAQRDIYADDTNNADRGEFPWNVGVFTISKGFLGDDQHIFHCGGTVIDEFVILTAASCVRGINEKLTIMAGFWNLADEQEKRQIRAVKKLIIHPKFVPTSKINDIALLLLDDKLDFAPRVNRVCLPDHTVDFRESNCFVTGWGAIPAENSTEHIRPKMKLVRQYLVAHEQCEKQIKRSVLTFQLSNVFQCATGVALCEFDVGSPLMCTVPGRENQFYQVGVFSYIPGTCNLGIGPNVFTKVSVFRKWIDRNLEENQRSIYVYVPESEDSEENETQNE